MRRHIRTSSTAAFLAAISASTLSAQATVSVSLVQTRPVGAFAANVDNGYGAFAAFLLPLDRAGVLSFRADVGYASYGHEERRTAFSESVGGRVEVDVNTTNTLQPAIVGLQLTLPTGPARPYLNAGAGVQFFETQSSVGPTAGSMTLATSVNQSDIAFAWSAGGGLYVPLPAGKRSVQLDLGGQYFHGGRAEYLAPGSIEDHSDGTISIAPMESSTHLWALRLGVRVGL